MHKFQSVRPLHNEDDYEKALAAIKPYIAREPEAGTEEADHYDLLAMVIEKYEDQHHPIPEADPVEVVRMVMESRGYEQRDLAEVLGSASRASEILRGKRDMTLDHIRRLRAAWDIPADALIGPLEAVA